MTGYTHSPYGQEVGGYSYFMPEESPHIGHSHHLCEMARTGNVSLKQMKDLIKNAKYMCKRCGRAAKNEENLCDAVPL